MTEGERAAVRLAEGYWSDLLELDPVLATHVGVEEYDDRLPDPSETGRARRETVHREALAECRRIELDGLGTVARTTLDLVEAIAGQELDALRHRFDRFEAASHLGGPASLLADISSLQRVDSREGAERYLRRLAAFPAYLDAVSDLVREGAGSGLTVPAVVAERAIAQAERLVALAPEASPALVPLAHASDEDREQARDVVADLIWPAYGRYVEALREYRPEARETFGLCDLPDGDRMYASLIRSWTSLELDPQRIHEMGLEELEAIQDERDAIARALGHPDPRSALAAYRASGAGVARSREEMVRLAEAQVRMGWEAAPRFFGRLPTANCRVRAVEEYREADMPFAFYFGPTADGSRPGTYYVNASDLPNRPLHHLATTTYHEANPGHHFQVSLEFESPGRPSLRRFGSLLTGNAFTEGWGLYAERLADEMGLFVDEYERLGMLDAQGMRAARLVVDTGIHAFRWTRERSVATLEATGVEHVDAVIETDRYIAMPAQALCYKLGQREIQRWRGEAERREGASFSLPRFHDRLLDLGSLPLPSLERELQRAADASSG